MPPLGAQHVKQARAARVLAVIALALGALGAPTLARAEDASAAEEMWTPGAPEPDAPPAEGMWSPGAPEPDAPPADDMWTPGTEEPAAPAAPALAGELTATKDEPLLDVRFTGYGELRLGYSEIDVHGLVPTDDLPVFHPLLEANAQARWRWGRYGFLSADISGVYQRGVLFYMEDPAGERVEAPDHDVPSLRPFVSFNELYASINLHDHFNVTVGRKRVVWGSGFALNPSDILNPAKDPTDPTSQRAGAWLAMLEAPFARFTLSALISPQVTRQAAGVPTAMVVEPDHPTYEQQKQGEPYAADGQAHWALLARAYALLFDTDINLVYAFSNRYRDAFVDHHRVSLSLSRYVLDELELHVEALGQMGSARTYFDVDCLESPFTVVGCIATGRPVAGTFRTNEEQLRPKVIAGGRYTFGDDSMLSAEYYYAGDGYGDRQYAAFVRALSLTQEARRAGLLPPDAEGLLGPQDSADASVPQKLTFEPLRRHYLFVSYSKPRIFDDFTFATTMILNLHDLSGQLAPSVTWSTTEWLQLGAFAFITLPGFGELAPTLDEGEGIPEMALSPIDWRFLMSARVFY